ncbi:hypothetical protein JAO32_13105 [Terriglobus sp. ADX1]
MKSPATQLRKHHFVTALAVSGIVLLGCASKVQIQVPANFHGHVHIVCTGMTKDASSKIVVDNSGAVQVNDCPLRQTDAVVTEPGTATPVSTAIMWTTTGDGLVREINFDIR